MSKKVRVPFFSTFSPMSRAAMTVRRAVMGLPTAPAVELFVRVESAMSVPTSTRSRWIGIAGALVALALAAIVYLGFFRGRAETKKIRVDHYLRPAMTDIPCLLMRVDEGNGMQPFVGDIEGFHFTWGTSYELTVKVEKVSNPSADGSPLRYTLVSIDKESKVPLGTRFSIVVFDRVFLQDQSILSQRRFEFASDKVREDFEKRQASLASKGEPFRAEFSHPNDPEKPLVLEGVSDAK
jgi:hypothetical protein